MTFVTRSPGLPPEAPLAKPTVSALPGRSGARGCRFWWVSSFSGWVGSGPGFHKRRLGGVFEFPHYSGVLLARKQVTLTVFGHVGVTLVEGVSGCSISAGLLGSGQDPGLPPSPERSQNSFPEFSRSPRRFLTRKQTPPAVFRPSGARFVEGVSDR